MKMNLKKRFKTSNLRKLILCLIFSNFSVFAAEKYPATVEDGTAKVIRSNTVVDAETQEAFLNSPKTPVGNHNEPSVVFETPQVEAIATTTATSPAPTTPKASAPQNLKVTVRSEATVPSSATNVTHNYVIDELADLRRQNERLEKRLQDLEQSKAEVRPNNLPTVSVPAAPTTFDSVPEKHVADLSMRLKYANEILKRFGRAYDYRTVTLGEFKKTLAQLENQLQKSN